MKAVVVQKWGEKSVLMNRPDPKPGPMEAVMRVRAAGEGWLAYSERLDLFTLLGIGLILTGNVLNLARLPTDDERV